MSTLVWNETIYGECDGTKVTLIISYVNNLRDEPLMILGRGRGKVAKKFEQCIAEQKRKCDSQMTAWTVTI